jgi:hypothetical protein
VMLGSVVVTIAKADKDHELLAERAGL